MLVQGDCLEKLKEIKDNSVDSIVSDPPYGISFMGKKWDYDVPSVDVWKECLRVLKPGGHALIACGTRTQHRMAVNLEDAGFEIRDLIFWHYASGFPKSSRVNLNSKFCQCVSTGRNDENTNPLPSQHDHKNKELGEHDDDLLSKDALHLKNKELDSQDDYQQDCDLNDEQLLENESHDQESPPLSKCAQAHNRSSLPDDVQASESLHTPSSAQCSDHLSNQDCFHHESSANAKLKNTHESNKPSDISKSDSDKQDNYQDFSYNKVNKLQGNYSIAFPPCQKCGKPNADGWGSALKPSTEIWTLLRKPLSEKTIGANVLKWGTGGINIDGCRVEKQTNDRHDYGRDNELKNSNNTNSLGKFKVKTPYKEHTEGRFPANIILDEEAGKMLDKQSGDLKSGALKPNHKRAKNSLYGGNSLLESKTKNTSISQASKGGASRFFYCAKSSKSERNRGLDSTLTVKYNNCINLNKEICKEEKKVAVQLLKKVMSATETMSFNIGESGESIMVQCHKDSLSTTLMEIKRIIGLKTLDLLTLSLTKEYTVDANLEKGNGGNLVENVKSLRKWLLTITKGQMELALGANNVALQTLLKISEKENWQESTNFHSTVKPIKLMRYLCRLITPKGGIVLDPYMGSGSTGIGAKLEGFDFIGIEKEEDYIKIAEARIEAWEEDRQEVLI